MKERKIKFVCNAYRWFDKANGNTYHSVRVTRVKDGETIVHAWTYGYGDHYRQTALEIMSAKKFLPVKYRGENKYLYERENNYPIYWQVSDGLKRECVSNGIL